MNKKTNNEFVEKLKSELTKDKNVKAIILYGSYVSGKADKKSDLDIVVFVDERNYEKSLIEISEKTYDIFKEFFSLFPSLNIWKTKNSQKILPHYVTCFDLENIKVIYDKINFTENLKKASKKIGKSYTREKLRNGKFFWYDKNKEFTKIIKESSFRKYESLKKYANIAFKNKDFESSIELNYKASWFLITSLMESKGIHAKGKNDYFFVDREDYFKSKKHFNTSLKKYYALLNIRKSTIPFNKNINKTKAKNAKKIREFLENKYKSL